MLKLALRTLALAAAAVALVTSTPRPLHAIACTAVCTSAGLRVCCPANGESGPIVCTVHPGPCID